MLDYLPGVGTNLKEWVLGGSEPGPGTLVNFYAIHTAILPALLLIALPFHFWRIRKAKGLVIPRSMDEDPDTQGELVDTMPHLIVREVAMAVLVLAVILVVAMLFNAPLTDQANPGLSPNPTKAPWYFVGIQELLMHFHPVFAVLVIPLTLFIGLLSIPYLKYDTDSSGVWFVSQKGRGLALLAVAVAIAGTVAGVLLDELVFVNGVIGSPDMVSTGLLPFAIILGFCTGFYFLLKKGFKASNNEAVQALFTLLTTAFVVLTVIGIWFRGTGMQLMWAG
jgi:quinol-cytochrome oxidoreductase complex cytochrome b subunit